MHSFIIGFVEKHLDHSTVSLHGTKRLEMSNDGCHHSGDSRNGFQINGTIEYLVGGDFSIPACGRIKEETHRLDGSKGEFVRKSLRRRVGQLDVPVHVGMTLVEKEFVATASQLEGIALFVVIRVVTFVTLDHAIHGLDKLVKGDTASRFARVEEFPDFYNFVFGKGIVVLAKQGLEFFGINAVGRIPCVRLVVARNLDLTISPRLHRHNLPSVVIDIHRIEFVENILDHIHVQNAKFLAEGSGLFLDDGIRVQGRECPG